jgi:hypothetical protein
VARTQAIAAVGRAILGLLADNVPRAEFPDARFELYQPSNFNNSPISEGITLFLYRVEVNASLRNVSGGVGVDGLRRRPPLPLDLYYLMTAWARDAARQQRLLGLAMRTLEDASILSAGALNNAQPETDVFRPHETVELLLGTLSLQDLTNLYGAYRISPPVSVVYIARIVCIDSTMLLEESAPVQTRQFDMAKNQL